MTFRTYRAMFASALVLVLGLGLYSIGCSKSTSPGGGGGGTPPAGPSFNFSFPAQGASAFFAFADAGTWGYHCIPHGGAGMTGTVIVSAAGADSALVDVSSAGGALSFSPSSVTIKPGGTVRWVNRSTMTIHTVTRP